MGNKVVSSRYLPLPSRNKVRQPCQDACSEPARSRSPTSSRKSSELPTHTRSSLPCNRGRTVVSLPNTDWRVLGSAARNSELGPHIRSAGPGPWGCSRNPSPAELADPAAPPALPPPPLESSRPPPAFTDTDRAPTTSPKWLWQESQPGFLWPSSAGPGAARGLGPRWPQKEEVGALGCAGGAGRPKERPHPGPLGPVPAPRPAWGPCGYSPEPTSSRLLGWPRTRPPPRAGS